jgi:hypothetical protein
LACDFAEHDKACRFSTTLVLIVRGCQSTDHQVQAGKAIREVAAAG